MSLFPESSQSYSPRSCCAKVGLLPNPIRRPNYIPHRGGERVFQAFLKGGPHGFRPARFFGLVPKAANLGCRKDAAASHFADRLRARRQSCCFEIRPPAGKSAQMSFWGAWAVHCFAWHSFWIEEGRTETIWLNDGQGAGGRNGKGEPRCSKNSVRGKQSPPIDHFGQGPV